MNTPFLYTDVHVALDRLSALGLRHLPALDLRVEHPRIGVGVLERLFGVLGDVYEARTVATDRDETIDDHLLDEDVGLLVEVDVLVTEA